MKVDVLNVAMDLGAGRRGTDMGPSAMHVAGVVPALRRLGHEVRAVEDVRVCTPETTPAGDARTRYLPEILGTVARLANRVEEAAEAGGFPLVLGGDHAQAIGTITGLARYWRRRGKRIGVLWVDAHTDMNTPDSSPSGNIHGMPLAVLLGHGPEALVRLAGDRPALDPRDVAILGARSIDDTEAPLVKELGVRVYTMSELDRRGTATCLAEALDRVLQGTAGVHLSFDLDGVDPHDAPGVGTPVPGGLSLRESHLVCESAAHTGRLLGMEMVELNPTLDTRNQTGHLAVWLIESGLGRVIL